MAAIPDPVCILLGQSQSPVTAINFGQQRLDNEQILYSGNQDGYLFSWNVARRRLKMSKKAHSGSVLGMVIYDYTHLFTHGRDGFLKKWEISGGEFTLLEEFYFQYSGFCSAKLLQKAEEFLLAIPTDDKSVLIFDPKKKVERKSLTPTRQFGMVMGIVPLDDAHCMKLLASYESGNIVLWNVLEGLALSEIQVFNDCVTAFDFKTDFQNGIAVSTNDIIVAFSIMENSLKMGKMVKATNSGFNAVSIRGTGNLFITCGWDGNIRYYSLKKLKLLAVVDYFNESVLCGAFSEKYFFAAGCKDGNIAMWNLYYDV